MTAKLLLVALLAMGAILPATPSFTTCQTDILETLDLVLNMTSILVNYTTSQESIPILHHWTDPNRLSANADAGTSRTRRSASPFIAAQYCRVAKTALENLHDDLNSTLSAAESKSQTYCATSKSTNETTYSCTHVLKLVQCGVRHLKAAYATSEAPATLEQQAKWESVANLLATDTSKVIRDMSVSFKHEWSLKLDVLSSNLNDFAATVSCMKNFIRAKIIDTVVDKVLLGETEKAATWLKRINLNVEQLDTVIFQTFFRLPKNNSLSSTRRLEAVSTVVELLTTLDTHPQLATRGYLHVVQGMKAAGLWPNLYTKFKNIIDRVNMTKCLPAVAKIRLLSLQKSLAKALENYTAAIADFIHAQNPWKAKELFVNQIGDDPDAIVAVVANAYSRGRDNLGNVLTFLEILNNQLYSEKGLYVLYDAMKSKNDITTGNVLKLDSHYKRMRLSDQSLGESIRGALEAYQQLQDLITQQREDRARIKAQDERARKLEEENRLERERNKLERERQDATIRHLQQHIDNFQRTTTEAPGFWETVFTGMSKTCADDEDGPSFCEDTDG